MSDFQSQPFFQIARRLEIRGTTGWLAVLSSTPDSRTNFEELQTELRSILQKPVRIVDLEPSTFEGLREALHEPDDDAVVLSAGAGLSQEKWRALDIMRSAMERPGPVILWLAPADVANLANFAPNIRSLIGSDYFIAGPDGGIMTEAERQQRLRQLSDHFGFGGDDAVRKAEAGQLPHEPEYVEWLVLMGRGDLV